jgi:hypothetical protein
MFPRRWLTASDKEVLKVVSKAKDALPEVTSDIVDFTRTYTAPPVAPVEPAKK